MIQPRQKDMVEQHLERCIELYGNPIDSEFKRRVDLASYEQMRADLILCVGMLMALRTSLTKEGKSDG